MLSLIQREVYGYGAMTERARTWDQRHVVSDVNVSRVDYILGVRD